MPQLRQNIITGEWVVIAPERAKRPNDYVTADTVKRQAKGECVFCAGKDEYQRRIKKYDKKHVWVIGNKFPAFIEDDCKTSPRSYKIEDDFYRARASVGGHDVVVIKDHNLDVMHFTKEIWTELLKTFKERYSHFDKHCDVEYTMPIYNHLPEAGASIEHPHAQIFASNIIPNIISREVHQTQKYFEKNGKCVFCELIEHEQKFKVRLVYENKDFIAFTFYAARFPFEVWILPKNHQSKFENEKDGKFNTLSDCLIDVLGKIDKTLNNPPLNLFIHSSPNNIGESSYYHWHIEIAPRITGYGGFEMGSGTIIDVFSPEKAAEFLKGKK